MKFAESWPNPVRKIQRFINPLADIDRALTKLKHFETDLVNPEVNQAVSAMEDVEEDYFTKDFEIYC